MIPTHFSVLFYHGNGAKSRSIIERLIRLWTRSRYSHVEIVLGDRTLRAQAGERVAFHDPLPQEEIDANWDTVSIAVTPEDYNRALVKGVNEVGCIYDWKGIFLSQIIGLRREHPERWFCSELVSAILKETKLGLILVQDEPCSYSPGSLYRAVTLGKRQ